MVDVSKLTNELFWLYFALPDYQDGKMLGMVVTAAAKASIEVDSFYRDNKLELIALKNENIHYVGNEDVRLSKLKQQTSDIPSYRISGTAALIDKESEQGKYYFNILKEAIEQSSVSNY